MQSALLSFGFSVALALGVASRLSGPSRDLMRSSAVVVAQDEGMAAVPGSAEAPAVNSGDEDDGGSGGAAMGSEMPGDTESAQQPSTYESDDDPSAEQPSSSDDVDNPSVRQPAGDNGGEIPDTGNAPSDDDD
jgi:hypothetical protein